MVDLLKSELTELADLDLDGILEQSEMAAQAAVARKGSRGVSEQCGHSVPMLMVLCVR